jgi:hypothetical protein
MLTASQKRLDKQSMLTPAVVKVGAGGRGFIVETEQGDRIVITAAHCVAADDRQLPRAHPWSYLHERTYQRVLGPLGKAKPTVWAECLFADPLADIAVLGSPDSQELSDQAEAYEALTSVAPFAVGAAPKQGVKRIENPFKSTKFPSSFEVRTPGKCAALVLSLAGEWIECTVTRRGPWLAIDQESIVKGGMSGSPIVSRAGLAIGLISTDNLSPVLLEALPPRIGLAKIETD